MPKLEVTTPWTGQTAGVEAIRAVRLENSPSSSDSRELTREVVSSGTPGPPTPLATLSERPATMASLGVRASKSESCFDTPSRRWWSAAAVERSRAFSATACRYWASRRVEAKKAQPKATAATSRPAVAAGGDGRGGGGGK